MASIKVSVKALIIQNGQVLCVKHLRNNQVAYSLPGGKPKPNESLSESLCRECHEEIGASIGIGDIYGVFDFFKPPKPLKQNQKHVVEVVFTCTLPNDYLVKNGHSPDKGQLGVAWLNLKNLSHINLYPSRLKDMLENLASSNQVYYCLNSISKF
jgi:ADP-ribose pyrophosphatase YjhB (NUDIX family)